MNLIVHKVSSNYTLQQDDLICWVNIGFVRISEDLFKQFENLFVPKIMTNNKQFIIVLPENEDDAKKYIINRLENNKEDLGYIISNSREKYFEFFKKILRGGPCQN